MDLRIVDLIKENIKSKNQVQNIDFKPIKLDYNYDELIDFIDAETMKIHYTKHYKGYIDKLNELLKERNLNLKKNDSISSLMSKVNGLGKKIKNQAGGVFNHELFWKIMTPDNKKKKYEGEIKKLIDEQFGSLDKFIEEFTKESKSKFGSGWCWLILKPNKKLKIMTTSNQDNPMMNIFLTKDKYNDGSVVYKSIPGKLLLGLDLWEHSYYLKYRNKKEDYIKNFWKVVNWDYVNELIKKEPK